MKIVSAILCFHIMLLVAAPSFRLAYVFHEKNSCSKSRHGACCDTGTKEQRPVDKHGNCCDLACNPFMFCCNCYAIIAQSQKISPLATYSNLKYDHVSEAFHSYFLSEAWKPPRIV